MRHQKKSIDNSKRIKKETKKLTKKGRTIDEKKCKKIKT